MEQYAKEEPRQNNAGRELFVSADSDEVIPEQMMDVDDESSNEENSDEEISKD